jgi:AcrR family transcriptional regulator
LDATVTARILEATLALTAQRGYQGLRIEDIAARCATSKQALYRRWPTKPDLVAAALEAALEGVNPDPPDGPFREALVVALSNVARLVATTPFGGAVAAVLGVHNEPALAQSVGAAAERRRGLLRALFARAGDRGEYPAGRDVDLDIDALLGALYFRALFRKRAIDADFVAALVDQWRAGAAAGR